MFCYIHKGWILVNCFAMLIICCIEGKFTVVLVF